jgi:predicted NBD/HSP70 family sugar kinase
VEVGGGSVETVVLGQGAPQVTDGVHPPEGMTLLLAVPGIVLDGRVVAASNLDWYDVDPAHELGLATSAALVLNDAEAAALGEAALRGATALSYVGLGTGVGGAVVRDGAVPATNLLGHGGSFSERDCPCGRIGCLETVAGGWALPDPLSAADLGVMADALAVALHDEPLATSDLVVVAGGLARRYPAVVTALAKALPDKVVEPSAAPPSVKSAAAWGLALAFERADAVA